MKNNLFIYRTLIGPEFALHCEAESFIAFWTKSQKRNKLICPKYWNKIWIQIWVAVHRFVALKRLCGPWCGVAHQRRAESGEREAECIWYCWTSKQIISHQEPFSGKPANISSYSKYLIAPATSKVLSERRYFNATTYRRWCIFRGFCKMLYPGNSRWERKVFNIQLSRRIQMLWCKETLAES